MGSFAGGWRRGRTLAAAGCAWIALAACGNDEESSSGNPYLRLFTTEATATRTADPIGVWTTPDAHDTVRIELTAAELVVAKRCRPPDGSSLLYVGVTVPIALRATEIEIKEGRGSRVDGSSGHTCAIAIPTATVPYRLSNAELEVSLEGPPTTFQKLADSTAGALR